MIFFEPKALYRASVEDVPVGDYEIELGKAKVWREGKDITVVGWGGQMLVLKKAVEMAAEIGEYLHLYLCMDECMHACMFIFM